MRATNPIHRHRTLCTDCMIPVPFRCHGTFRTCAAGQPGLSQTRRHRTLGRAVSIPVRYHYPGIFRIELWASLVPFCAVMISKAASWESSGRGMQARIPNNATPDKTACIHSTTASQTPGSQQGLVGWLDACDGHGFRVHRQSKPTRSPFGKSKRRQPCTDVL
jgi:hypothetical protein